MARSREQARRRKGLSVNTRKSVGADREMPGDPQATTPRNVCDAKGEHLVRSVGWRCKILTIRWDKSVATGNLILLAFLNLTKYHHLLAHQYPHCRLLFMEIVARILCAIGRCF
jgi:hypothetical protein